MKLFDKIKVIWAVITGNVDKGFDVLSKHVDTLTTIATTVQVLTGNEELVELTKKAGQAVKDIDSAIDNGQDAFSAIADQVDTVASSEGSEKVAKVAKKVSKGAKKVADVVKK